MLLPEHKRKKTIGVRDIEAVVAKMARIPPEDGVQDDAEEVFARWRRI
jgi:ATP-dependent Clp protease ATP-binding subunit ClpA